MSTLSSNQLLMNLGISSEVLTNRNLMPYEEADSLEMAELGDDGREHYLIEEAAVAWKQLKADAVKDGEEVFIVSAYRSISRQAEIISNKIDEGIEIDEILLVCAPPGYSEHHTGRAVDLSTPTFKNLCEEFEESNAFKWLVINASKYNFSLSYPRCNSAGYHYEPWHWCYHAT